MERISTLAQALSLQKTMGSKDVDSAEMASFGAVHLNNTSIDKAMDFWTKVIGLKVRSLSEDQAEFGTDDTTIVVVHKHAKVGFREGYSGLYHFAIHLPNKAEFANAIHRLRRNKYSFSPIDHTMTQSLYLTDHDNVMVELALETPERFKRVITEGGLFMEDANGVIRGASAPLDIDEILKDHQVESSPVMNTGSKIGHIHFYAHDVVSNNAFYKKIGFTPFNFFPQYKYADLGAGGVYQHRIAMNAWHGQNKPLAPADHAGLRHYEIVFHSADLLHQAVAHIDGVEEREGGFWTNDPTGVVIKLTAIS